MTGLRATGACNQPTSVLGGQGLRAWPDRRPMVCTAVLFAMKLLMNRFALLAVAVVAIELGAIAWIRKRYMDTPLLQAIFQVVLGGILVFLTGILIGNI